MTRTLITAVLLTLVTTGIAVAGHCPKDAKAIEQALSRTNMSPVGKQNIRTKVDRGMQLHRSGDHRKSEAILAEAMREVLVSF